MRSMVEMNSGGRLPEEHDGNEQGMRGIVEMSRRRSFREEHGGDEQWRQAP